MEGLPTLGSRCGWDESAEERGRGLLASLVVRLPCVERAHMKTSQEAQLPSLLEHLFCLAFKHSRAS